jgi:predicted DCC family thiol-disulfide oxidoreductase YuxK
VSKKRVEVFFDGGCPLCVKEMKMLEKIDFRNNIAFTDIAVPSFNAEQTGRTWDELMASIHGRLPDGTVIEGVEVFRQLYAAVGFGPLVSLSRAPGISGALDAAYSVFARNRLRLTGRCDGEACQLPSVAAEV